MSRPAPTLRVSWRRTLTARATGRLPPLRDSNGSATRRRRPATRTWWIASSWPDTAPGNSRKTRVMRSSSSRDERSSRGDGFVTVASPRGRTLPRCAPQASMPSRSRPSLSTRHPQSAHSRRRSAVRMEVRSGDTSVTSPEKPVTSPDKDRPGPIAAIAVRPVAVLDMGASAIRLVVAEAPPGEPPRILEEASRGVLLGKDTFTHGRLGAATHRGDAARRSRASAASWTATASCATAPWRPARCARPRTATPSSIACGCAPGSTSR